MLGKDVIDVIEQCHKDSPETVRQYGKQALTRDLKDFMQRGEEDLRNDVGDSAYEQAVDAGKIIEHQFSTTLSKNTARPSIPQTPRPDLAIVRMVQEFSETTEAGIFKGDMAAYEERWQGTIAVVEKLGSMFSSASLDDGNFPVTWGDEVRVGTVVDLAPLSGDFFHVNGNTTVQYRYVNARQILGVILKEGE